MILNTKEFASACKTILAAVDNKAGSGQTFLFTETLELKTEENILKLNVTNRDYYVTVKFNVPGIEQFHASVNAKLFLTLISKLTTEKLEITKEGNSVKINANGTYKLPIIYANDRMLELPTIEIGNVTNEMTINSNTLHSIAIYNSKELMRGAGLNLRPVQNYYYIDELGAITCTSGACVNNFTLEKSIKMLLDDKVVKLFKLFKEDTPVSFTMGQDELTEDLIQTKVCFKTDNIILTANLRDFGLVSSVPVTAIRTMASKNYMYSVVASKNLLLQTIQRLLLFNETETIGTLEFTNEYITIFDNSGENREKVKLENKCETLEKYSLKTDLMYIKSILEGIEEEYVTINFGDGKAVVIQKANISDIIPER